MTWTTPDRGEIRDLAARNLFGKSYETLLLEQARAIDSMNAGRLRVEVRNMTARRRFGRPFAELTPEQARVVVMTKSRPGSAVNAAVMDRASSKPAAARERVAAGEDTRLRWRAWLPGTPRANSLPGRGCGRNPGLRLLGHAVPGGKRTRLSPPPLKSRPWEAQGRRLPVMLWSTKVEKGRFVMNETQMISAVGYVAGVSTAAALVGYLIGGTSIALVLVLVAVPVGMFRALRRP